MIRPAFLIALVAPFANAAPVDYTRDIQPLFAEHCLECHGPDASKGGLNLTTRDNALKELKSGAHGIVPGKADHSALIERALTSDLDDRMPPKDKKPLKPAEIETLKAWINEGAKFDLHWSYQPLMKLPNAKRDAAQIDTFVQAKLKENQLAPSPEADRYTLIKRAYYDLLGLPPTPEAIDAFVQDKSPKAFEALLDQLLQSPHFGERWGRHWLDAARYADSDGYEKDRPRPDAWRYRDWVIRAINDDLPFDQFTIQQLAGDLLPSATEEQIVATAFHRQTLTNTEGGADQEQFRVEAVFDRTETLGTVWLGLTIGCARCHTHKYDQITHQEYYQLFAFFNNGDEVTRKVPESPEKWAEYQRTHGSAAARLVPLQKKLDAAKSALPVKLPQWEKAMQPRLAAARASKATQTFAELTDLSITATSKAKFKPLPDSSLLAQGKKVPATDAYTVEAKLKQPVTAIRIEVLPDPSLPSSGPGRKDNGNFVITEIKVAGSVLHSPAADYSQKSFSPDYTLDGDPQTGWAVGGGTGKPHTLTLQLATPLPAGSSLSLTLEQSYTKQPQHVLGRFRVLTASEETEASLAPAAVVKLLDEEPQRRNPVLIKPLFDWLEKVDTDVIAASAAYELAKAKLPKPPLMDVRVIGQRAANLRETKVLHRGEFLQPTDAVVPASLSVLPPVKAAAKTQASRLDLARWLVSPQNPLTPRVTVNHVWGKLFGEGLVKTSADFGVRGSQPTHPELLDWLAHQFIEQGWSRKKLIKLIMMSGTYRQSSGHESAQFSVRSAKSDTTSTEHFALSTSPAASDLDPRNELLWRQNRLRVEGEIVRDLHLAASGLLSAKIGGPSVFPPMPPDIADLSYANNFKWATSTGEDRFRRGFYTFFKRTAPHPDLTTFDCPDANLTNIKRTVSNTPLQALTTLNAEAFSEASRAMSQRVLKEPLKTDTDRLTRAFRLCLGRLPSAQELAALDTLLHDSRAYYQSQPEEAKAMTGTYSVPDAAPHESAAWAATARIILNMDEFITRE